MLITVFTPIYNRAYCIEQLYKSLTRQIKNNFKWIIVDDGSTDNIDEIVDKFLAESNFPIEYYKQNNNGKHIAHNLGVLKCDTELFVCIDSDDYLVNDATAIIEKEYTLSGKLSREIGIVALRGYSNMQTMGNNMPKGIKTSTLSDLYNIYGKKSETTLIFKTKYLKKIYFPKFGEENFLSEEFLYNKLDYIGKLYVVDKILTICEYQEGGLTRNIEKVWLKNPKGVIEMLKGRYNTTRKLPVLKKIYRQVKCILVLNAFCIASKNSLLKNSPNKIKSILLLVPSFYIKKIKFDNK